MRPYSIPPPLLPLYRGVILLITSVVLYVRVCVVVVRMMEVAVPRLPPLSVSRGKRTLPPNQRSPPLPTVSDSSS